MESMHACESKQTIVILYFPQSAEGACLACAVLVAAASFGESYLYPQCPNDFFRARIAVVSGSRLYEIKLSPSNHEIISDHPIYLPFRTEQQQQRTLAIFGADFHSHWYRFPFFKFSSFTANYTYDHCVNFCWWFRCQGRAQSMISNDEAGRRQLWWQQSINRHEENPLKLIGAGIEYLLLRNNRNMR